MDILNQISDSDKRKIVNAKKIAVAVSGGSDSLTLVILSKSIAKDSKTEIIALTIDHKLRQNSTQEAQKVAAWMRERDIYHCILTWDDDKKPTSNIQHNARQARYNLLTDYCKKNSIDLLLIGHNLEDQAETLLMRIMRGSGVDGLAGIAHSTNINGVEILRPLLRISKDDIKKYLTSIGQEWVEDPSNKDKKYTRVLVRNFLNLSDNKSLLINRLNESTNNISQSKSYLEHKIALDMQEAVKIHDAGYVTIDKQKFKSLHIEAGQKILAKTIKIVGGNYYKPRFEKIKNLYSIIQNNPLFSSTLGGCEIWQSPRKLEQNLIYISREISQIEPPIYLNNSEQKYLFDQRFEVQISPDLNIRNHTIECLSTNDITKLKIPTLPKKIIKSIPCLKLNDEIIACPSFNFYKTEELSKLINIKFCS